jgi:hypothetical protein
MTGEIRTGGGQDCDHEYLALIWKACAEDHERGLAQLGDAVKDACWKATPMGETADGDVHAYILPKGTMHRLIGVAQGLGIDASFRAIEKPIVEPTA